MSSQYYHIKRHVAPCQHIRHYPHATANAQEDKLHLVIKQYIPLDNRHPMPGDVTIIACHGSGLAKELYEPLWDELYMFSKSSKAFSIRAIWAVDIAQQGESGLLNESKLGNDPSWFDHSRDLLGMVNHFREDMPMPLVGFGHSMGGTQIAYLALLHPRLLSALILVDPAIYPRPSAHGRNLFVAYSSTLKQDNWTNREEAEKSFRKNPFYRGWDPRVVELYLKHSLRQVCEGSDAVTLTTSKHQEVLNIARPAYPPRPDQPMKDFKPSRSSHPDVLPSATGNIYQPPVPFYRPEGTMLFSQIPHIRPHVLYVSPSSSTITTPTARAEVIGAMGRGVGGNGGLDEGAVKEVVLDNSDHFVPLKAPLDIAKAMGEWLGQQTERWAMEAEEWNVWKSLPGAKKRMVDEDWPVWMRRHYGHKNERRKAKLMAKI